LVFFRQNKDKITVSDVRQLPFTQAAVAIQGSGLQVGQKLEAVTADDQGGRVLDQDPKQNSHVAKGSRVILTVGYSTPKASVPAVAGRAVAAATDVLTKAGFFNGRTQSRQSDKTAGIVIEQVPLPGGPPAALTQDITLVVSAGPSAVAVPAVAGSSEAAARKTLQSAGFMAISIKRSNDAAVPKDKVIGTEPAGQVAPTSPISIIVSDGPGVQAVPPLVGQTLAAAQQALLDQGLAVGTTTSKTGAPGQILEQDPPPGKSVSVGTAVNLTVGQAAGAAPNATIIDPRLMPSVRASPSATAVATTR
jgi:serine/threonine-protein kinase